MCEMQCNNFFWAEEQDIPAGSGFSLWGKEHLLALAVIALVIVALTVWFGKLKSEKQTVFLRIIAIALPILEVVRIVVLCLDGRMGVGHLPLHLCSLAIYIYPVIAFYPNEKVRGFLAEFSLITLLPASLSALLFPDWTMYPLMNFFSLHSFIWHGLQIAFPIHCLMVKWYSPNVRNLWKNTLFLLAGGVLVGLFDSRMSCNYWFLRHPVPDTPLEWIYNIAGAKWYVASLLLLSILVNLAVYAVYYLYANHSSKKIER